MNAINCSAGYQTFRQFAMNMLLLSQARVILMNITRANQQIKLRAMKMIYFRSSSNISREKRTKNCALKHSSIMMAWNDFIFIPSHANFQLIWILILRFKLKPPTMDRTSANYIWIIIPNHSNRSKTKKVVRFRIRYFEKCLTQVSKVTNWISVEGVNRWPVRCKSLPRLKNSSI